jgi:AcrR family transcriptional regulator
MKDKVGHQSKNERREKILQHAAKLFAQIGFEGTSFSAVADAAQEKKSLVQYHFENKDILWRESVSYIWQKRNDALPRYLDDLSLHQEADASPQIIRDLCRCLLHFTFDQPQWVKIMFQESSTPGPRLDWLVEQFLRDDFSQGQAMIELGQKLNLLPRVNPMDLLHILSGALIYLINVAPITERVLGVNPNSEAYIDQHIDTLMGILLSNVNAVRLMHKE